MDELCPLCLKMGSNRRIKAVQINLEEALWMCENEECPWPFGHQVPTFLPRKVGSKWAYEWEIYKQVQKRVGPIPVSTELSLYTPPVTPSGDAATKESAKSDYSAQTNISELINHSDNMFSINSALNDSYAPKTSVYDEYPRNESNESKKLSKTSVSDVSSKWSTESRIIDEKCSVIPSIFDIDGDELLSNKISIKETSTETKTTEPSSPISVVLDVRNSPTIATSLDAVLETSEEPKISPEKHVETKKPIIVSTVQRDIVTREKPQIRSIARTNIDLKTMNCPKIIEIEDSLMKIEPTVNTESVVSSKEQSPNNIHSVRQHTTTIKVDGILPITLSYDLADLEEKSNDIIPVTSTPIRDGNNKSSPKGRNDEGDATFESSNELPKKQIRPTLKRRAAASGKQYEKFSFSSLKKFVRASDDCDDKTRTVTSSPNAGSSEEVKLEDIIVKDEKSSILASRIDPPDKIANNPDTDVANQMVESFNSVNMSTNNAVTSDDSAVENLNLSGVLDDILMEGYQNATENLNDDWLESFFTHDT